MSARSHTVKKSKLSPCCKQNLLIIHRHGNIIRSYTQHCCDENIAKKKGSSDAFPTAQLLHFSICFRQKQIEKCAYCSRRFLDFNLSTMMLYYIHYYPQTGRRQNRFVQKTLRRSKVDSVKCNTKVRKLRNVMPEELKSRKVQGPSNVKPEKLNKNSWSFSHANRANCSWHNTIEYKPPFGR